MAPLLMYSLLSVCIHTPISTRSLGHKHLVTPKNDSCVSGKIKVEEKTKGIVDVSKRSEGDVILGIIEAHRKPSWCKVVAIFPCEHGKNTITHHGLTADHMVVNHTVHPHGYKGVLRDGPFFALFTECDVLVNVTGKIFSPIDTALCTHELSWNEYVSLMAAVRRVAKRIGHFRLDMSAHHDNETAMLFHWFDQLHQIRRELLRCAREDRCQALENVMEKFMREHLNKENAKVIDRVFPNMGGDVNKTQAGATTEETRTHGSFRFVPLFGVGSAIGLLLLMAIAIILCGLRVMEKDGEGDGTYLPTLNEH